MAKGTTAQSAERAKLQRLRAEHAAMAKKLAARKDPDPFESALSLIAAMRTRAHEAAGSDASKHRSLVRVLLAQAAQELLILRTLEPVRAPRAARVVEAALECLEAKDAKRAGTALQDATRALRKCYGAG